MVMPVHDFLENFDAPLNAEFRRLLAEIWEKCNALTDEAFHCGDPAIFAHSEWGAIRELSASALTLIGWDELQHDHEALTQECRQKLYPYAFRH